MVICEASIVILICWELGFVGPAQQKISCLCLTVIDIIFWDFFRQTRQSCLKDRKRRVEVITRLRSQESVKYGVGPNS